MYLLNSNAEIDGNLVDITIDIEECTKGIKLYK